MTFDQIQKLCGRLNASPWQQRVLHEELADSPWHTGTPTEEGDYLLQIEHMCKTYFVAWTLKRFGEELIPKIPQSTVAWWKIEPYKEKDK